MPYQKSCKMPIEMTHMPFYITEKIHFRKVAKLLPSLISMRGLIAINDEFRNRCLLRVGISRRQSGWISLQTQLSLYDNGLWQYYEDGVLYYVFKIFINRSNTHHFIAINEAGEIIRRPSGRKYLIEYMKFPQSRKTNCNGKLVNPTKIIEYEKAHRINIF